MPIANTFESPIRLHKPKMTNIIEWLVELKRVYLRMLIQKTKLFLLSLWCILLFSPQLSFAKTSDTNKHPVLTLKKDSISGIYYSFHIAWEGFEVKQSNLNKLISLREKHPNMPVIHHISPAYFTSSEKKNNIKTALNLTFKKQDKLGVYLSGWRSVVEQAGVKFKSEKSFWGNHLADSCQDCGSEIPLTQYSQPEISKIVSWSIDEITDLGYGRPDTSYIEGWQGTEKILEVLVQNGIKIDFSMLSPYRVKESLKFFPIYQTLLDNWGYKNDTLTSLVRSFGNQRLIQIPNNFAHPGVIPLDNANKFLDNVFNAINRRMHTGAPVSIMVSQTRASMDIPHIHRFTRRILLQSWQNGVEFKYLTNSPLFVNPTLVETSATETWSWPNEHPKSTVKVF